MKTFSLVLFLALSVAACSEDTTAPGNDSLEFDELADMSLSASFVSDPGTRIIPILRFPDSLKLTTAQETQIKALYEQFRHATKAEREALAAIMKQAREAAHAGKSREEVRAILAQGDPIRVRLEAAEKKLHNDILAVLTAEQKAWLQSHHPKHCNAPPLTEAQRTQIAALIASFEQANKTDLEAIKKAHEDARAAAKAGATREQIHAILGAVAPAMARVAAARIELGTAIKAVLTPEQRACAPGAFRAPGTRRG